MIKSQLIARLAAENPQLTRADCERVVAAVLETLSQALEEGRRIELRGFGAFSVRARPAREGRNPRTGEAVAVPAKAAALFKAGKEMRERLNVDNEPDGHDDAQAGQASGFAPASVQVSQRGPSPCP